MTLVECSECGKRSSDGAEACMHCGCPITDQPPPAVDSLDSEIEDHIKGLPRNVPSTERDGLKRSPAVRRDLAAAAVGVGAVGLAITLYSFRFNNPAGYSMFFSGVWLFVALQAGLTPQNSLRIGVGSAVLGMISTNLGGALLTMTHIVLLVGVVVAITQSLGASGQLISLLALVTLVSAIQLFRNQGGSSDDLKSCDPLDIKAFCCANIGHGEWDDSKSQCRLSSMYTNGSSRLIAEEGLHARCYAAQVDHRGCD